MVYLQRWHGWCHMKLLPSRRKLCDTVQPCTMSLHARVWNGYRNKSQHRKLTLEKKFLPPLLQGFEPRPFNHESGVLTTELSPLPKILTVRDGDHAVYLRSVLFPSYRCLPQLSLDKQSHRTHAFPRLTPSLRRELVVCHIAAKLGTLT